MKRKSLALVVFFCVFSLIAVGIFIWQLNQRGFFGYRQEIVSALFLKMSNGVRLSSAEKRILFGQGRVADGEYYAHFAYECSELFRINEKSLWNNVNRSSDKDLRGLVLGGIFFGSLGNTEVSFVEGKKMKIIKSYDSCGFSDNEIRNEIVAELNRL